MGSVAANKTANTPKPNAPLTAPKRKPTPALIWSGIRRRYNATERNPAAMMFNPSGAPNMNVKGTVAINTANPAARSACCQLMTLGCELAG